MHAINSYQKVNWNEAIIICIVLNYAIGILKTKIKPLQFVKGLKYAILYVFHSIGPTCNVHLRIYKHATPFFSPLHYEPTCPSSSSFFPNRVLPQPAPLARSAARAPCPPGRTTVRALAHPGRPLSVSARPTRRLRTSRGRSRARLLAAVRAPSPSGRHACGGDGGSEVQCARGTERNERREGEERNQ